MELLGGINLKRKGAQFGGKFGVACLVEKGCYLGNAGAIALPACFIVKQPNEEIESADFVGAIDFGIHRQWGFGLLGAGDR